MGDAEDQDSRVAERADEPAQDLFAQEGVASGLFGDERHGQVGARLGGGELGGTYNQKLYKGIFFITLWVIYLVMSGMYIYGDISI